MALGLCCERSRGNRFTDRRWIYGTLTNCSTSNAGRVNIFGLTSGTKIGRLEAASGRKRVWNAFIHVAIRSGFLFREFVTDLIHSGSEEKWFAYGVILRWLANPESMVVQC